MNYNKVILVGRITHDPELKATTSGTEIVNFQLAVNRYGKDNKADFFRVVCFGKTAEFVSTYVIKGRLLLVEGSLRNNAWQDNTGQKRNSIEITASRVELMEKRTEATAKDPHEKFGVENVSDINADDDIDKPSESDEIPF